MSETLETNQISACPPIIEQNEQISLKSSKSFLVEFKKELVELKKSEEMSEKNRSILVDITRTTVSHRYCFVCHINNSSKNFKFFSGQSIIDAYVQKKILIPTGSRCCGEHLNEVGLLNNEALNQLIVVKKNV